MDNQQAKIEDIAWMAGFIDGDGSLCMTRTNAGKFKADGAPVGGFVPRLTICNTDWSTLDELKAIADSLSLPYHVYEDMTYYKKPHKSTHNPRWHWSVQGMKRMSRWLPVLIPYLKTKRRQAELLLEYSVSRAAKMKNSPLSERELEILDVFRNPHSLQRLNAAKGGGQNSSPTEWYSPPPLET
jgi:hypothetical protein